MLGQHILNLSRSKIFIGLCAVAFTLTTLMFEKCEVGVWYCIFVFFATFITYRASMQRDPGFAFLFRPLNMLIVAVMCLSFFITVHQHIDPFMFVLKFLPVFFLTLFYHLKFEMMLFKRRFNFFMLKTIILSLSYLYICVLIPLDFDAQFYRFIVHQFFFILLLCLIFDMRDIETDRLRNINTLATFFGFEKSKVLCVVLVVLKIVLLLVATRLDLAEKIALGLSDVFLLIHVLRLDRKNEELFYFFYLDGMMLLQCIIFAVSVFVF